MGWKDINNNDCGWYEETFLQNCTSSYILDGVEIMAGEIGKEYFGYVAFEACCKFCQDTK